MQIDKLCYEKPHFMSVSCCQNCFSCCVVQCSGISPPIFQLLLYPFQMLHDFLLSLCVSVRVCLWSMCSPVYCSRKLSKLLSGSQFDLICLCHRSNSNNNNRKRNYSQHKQQKELLYSSLFQVLFMSRSQPVIGQLCLANGHGKRFPSSQSAFESYAIAL